MTVGQPDKDSKWDLGSKQAITWSCAVQEGSVAITLVQGGIVKSTIAARAPNNGRFEWAIPATLAAGNYRVKVKWLSNPTVVVDDSDEFGLQVPGPLTVSEPTGELQQGSLQTIRWAGVPRVGNVNISLLQNGQVKATLAASTPNDGEFLWTVPVALAGAYAIRVTWLSKPVNGTSDITVATVAGPIGVTQPGLGTTVEPGALQEIVWDTIPVGGTVRILLYQGAATTPKLTITPGTPNIGRFPWRVPGTLAPAKNYKVKVVWLSKRGVSGTGEEFEVSAPPTMTVAQPGNGAVWNQGSTRGSPGVRRRERNGQDRAVSGHRAPEVARGRRVQLRDADVVVPAVACPR